MGTGWFVKVKMDDVSQLDTLMDEAAYLALVS
jgi:glycine cleavage system H lipoate-binding protein